MPLLHEETTSKILAACFEVSNELGAGFLESVYKSALIIALQEKGLTVEPEHILTVNYHGQAVGQFNTDLLIDNAILLELKAVPALTPNHKAEVINYLKASGKQVALLVNFGNPKLEYRRFTNHSPATP